MSPIPIVFISITVFLNIGSVSFGECCGNTTCSVHNCCVKHPGGYSCQPFSVLGGHCSQDYHPIETLGFENVYALTCPCLDGLSCGLITPICRYSIKEIDPIENIYPMTQQESIDRVDVETTSNSSLLYRIEILLKRKIYFNDFLYIKFFKKLLKKQLSVTLIYH